ncbi:MAG: stage II sporulation protein P [Veillonellaceae bacterium]|nr:stage II sporulation protein P [Veillonellaceae bacterium]
MLSRRQRKQYYSRSRVIIVSILAGLFFLLSAWAFLVRSAVAVPAVPVSAALGADILKKQELKWPNWGEVLFSGLPRFDKQEKTTEIVKKDLSVQHVLRGVVMLFTGIDIKDIRSLFHSEIPMISVLKISPKSISTTTLPNFPKFDPASLMPKGKPLVGVYHTHTAESFIPNSGVTHRPGGQRGEIVGVGESLVKRLKKHGVPAVQYTDIHDYPSFMKAYGVSEGTVRKMLQEHPSIQMIFDIHRDADKKENSTIVINDVSAARISIVVATGQQDLIQPHWQENHAFAKLIDAKLNQHYPGLSKGIHLVDWRYNQHLHPRALLIEVGCQENTKEEADRSIEMLGDVIAEIIAENNS